MIESTLGRLAAGENLSMAEMAAAMEEVVAGNVNDGEIGVLLTAPAPKAKRPKKSPAPLPSCGTT